MKREDAKTKLIEFGIPEPSEEMITNFLNSISAEVKTANDRAEKYKTSANKAEELQRQLDELNSQNLSEIEKANIERDKALQNVDALKLEIKSMQLKTGFAEIGIIGEDADTLIKSHISGNFDTASLGRIISEKVKSAIADFEKQTLNNTPNPNTNNGKSVEGGKSKGEELAMQAAKVTNTANEEILNYYRR